MTWRVVSSFWLAGWVGFALASGSAHGFDRQSTEVVRGAVDRVFEDSQLRRYRERDARIPEPSAGSRGSAEANARKRSEAGNGGARWLASLLLNGVSGLAGVLIGLACVLLAVIFAIGLRALLSRRGERSGVAPLRSDGSIALVPAEDERVSARERLVRAESAAREFRFEEALAELMFASQRCIEDAGLMPLRRGSTTRDYARALQNVPAAATAFSKVAWAFEEVWFGRRPAVEARWLAARSAYAEQLETLRVERT
ncbi:MAG: DUF4129 domain-containing protein [Planctomycetota bacterium]